MQNELRELHEHSIMWNEAKSSYEQTISVLNGRIANLETEVTRLNSLY